MIELPTWALFGVVMLLAVAMLVVGSAMLLHFRGRVNEELRSAYQGRDADMSQHDRIVVALTYEAAERHRRTCPRCRGDVLGHYSVGTDALTDFRP